MSRIELSAAALLDVLRSLLADELGHLRCLPAHEVHAEQWNHATCISRSQSAAALSLGADSLERLALATRVTDFFQLRETGVEDYLLRKDSLGEWVELIRLSRARGSRDLTFQTSGSSGIPSQCDHRWLTLLNEVGHFHAVFTDVLQQPVRRVIALVPCHHIYGFLFTLLLPDIHQLPVVRGHQALQLVMQRQLQPGDLLVGHPFIWAQISRSGKVFPAGVMGLTSTGPADPAVLEALLAQQLGNITEIYGATETAGVGYRLHHQQPFTLLPRWQRDAHHPASLLDASMQNAPAVCLPDHLQWFDERHFCPIGRKDHAVQVGGINVFPRQIEQWLESLPEVASARVRLMTPAEGQRLKAFIVPENPLQPLDELSELLQQRCEQHLAAVERPRHFSFGDVLPAGAYGKAADWPIQPQNRERYA
ncbi:AMP-binding enzyme [Marinospirillum alkaliphilum]|uniref:4-coumarate--CoA ligase, photoactive yellow protein activation family n=1 Tax=Marinospirillum alkaliphilum DSM 21637 TaxID=1122209 RepID=A0A1K1XY05_9GAMM|nr:AMP-binding protein [Marinospirillum alkaliphilum]SFX54496.1 4-coumarate--CoA ligase, photoactive yellow protein activation family [Marinospirillum alkaliphilum DSM 21637]